MSRKLEFEAIRKEMEECGIRVNVTAKQEHVPEVERQNRVIKERARAIIQTLPYNHIPRKIRIALIQFVVFWLNSIPKNGQDYSPRDLIFGEQKLNYDTVCQIPFGAYAQVHDDLEITNTMQSRTTGAISLGATGNTQGTYRFFNLSTGELIVRRKWTELPIPQEVIMRLQDMTYAELDQNSKVNFEGDEEEEDYYDEEQNKQQGGEEEQQEQENTNNHDDQETGNEQQPQTQEAAIEEQLTNQENEESQEKDIDAGREEITNEVTEQQRYNLRPNRSRDYAPKFTFLSVKAGLKKWGDKARAAVLDELLMFLQ